MNARFTPRRFLDHGQLGRWLTDASDMWQMDLLDQDRLASFAKDRGVGFWRDHIVLLWQLGLLRSDLAASPRKLRLANLVEVGRDGLGRYLFADERRPRRRSKGWASAAANLSPPTPDLELYFHPFRFYVLHHIWRLLSIGIARFQFFYYADGYPRLLEQTLSLIQDATADPRFLDNIDRWNNVVALAVATEPTTYERIFGSLKTSVEVDFESQRERILSHRNELTKFYRRAGRESIEQVHRQLCVDADLLEPNKDLHVMLRFMGGRFRSKMRGALGGSLLLLTMAEMIRRTAELVFGVELGEEDERGLGTMPTGVKEKVYGSNRLLDGPRTVANEFLRQFGLDYGVRVRWYVEGYTEYGAVSCVFGNYSGIDVVNLRGDVVQEGGRGVGFRASLLSDLKANVFSIITVDKDREDVIRVLRRAAEDDLICGRVFLSDPDIEQANFSLVELEQVLWDIAVENGATPSSRDALHDAIVGVNSGKELWSKAKSAVPELRMAGKGEVWGEKLMLFATDNPDLTDESHGTKKLRPLIEAVNVAARALGSNYQGARSLYKIDPQSLTIVERLGADVDR